MYSLRQLHGLSHVPFVSKPVVFLTDTLQSSLSASEQSSQKMTEELSELKRRLQEQEKSSEALEASSKSYYDMLARSKSTLGSLTAAMATTLEEKPMKNVKQEINGEK